MGSPIALGRLQQTVFHVYQLKQEVTSNEVSFEPTSPENSKVDGGAEVHKAILPKSIFDYF